MKSEKNREPGFEQDLERLEQIVGALEEGGLSLEQSLKQFEAGIRLARKCEKALREAERKIEILTQSMDGTLEARPFDEEAPASAPAARPAEAAEKAPSPDEDGPVDDNLEPPPFDDEDDLDALF